MIRQHCIHQLRELVPLLFLVAFFIPSSLQAQPTCEGASFSVTNTFPPGGHNAIDFELGDFNEDGKQDLIVACATSFNLFFLEGDGSGNFDIKECVETGGPTSSLKLADLDGDGHTDLVIGAPFKAYLGNGDGTFGVPTGLPSTGRGHVAVADMNNDGKLDVVVADLTTNAQNAEIYLGDGAGIFSLSDSYLTDHHSSGVALGHFNSDAYLDVVVSNWNGHSVTVLMNDGTGKFASAVEYPGHTYCQQVTTGDFNGDSMDDLAIVSWSLHSVAIRLNDGNGGFSNRTDYSTTGSAPNGIGSADINGDGIIDLAVCNAYSDDVTVFLGASGGTFSVKTKLPAGDYPTETAFSDVTNDGKPDLLVSHMYSSDVYIYEGDGTGGFTYRDKISFGGIAAPASILNADVNDDGNPDVITGNYSSKNVSVYLGTGNGDFQTPVQYPAHGNVRGIVLKDLDGDGDLDIAAGHRWIDGISVMKGDGLGSFAAPVHYAAGQNTHVIRAADVDGDADADLIAINTFSNDFSLLLNNGDATFGAATSYALGAEPRGLEVADFNGDGAPDVFIPLKGSKSALFYLGDGQAGFTAPVTISLPDEIESSLVGEYTNDSYPDIACTFVGSVDFHILPSNGLGGFASVITYTTNSGRSITTIGEGDFNADGYRDFALSQNVSNRVRILLGDPQCGFQLSVSVPTDINPRLTCPGDINGDGKPDIVTTNFSTDNLSLLMNTTTACSSISAPVITPAVTAPLLPQSTLSIAFVTDGFFYCNNSYLVELSDPNGDFSDPTVIGSGSAGPLTATIPSNIPSGSGYRIRVVSTGPVLFGSDNGADLTIDADDPPVAVCRDITITLSGEVTTLQAVEVDGGSSDDNGIVSMEISKSAFTCSDASPAMITLTVRDALGQSASCDAQVTLIGQPPEFTITSDPAVPVNPGGDVNTLYLGYGPSSVTLTASPAMSYDWYDGSTLIAQNQQSITVSPLASTTYTAIGTNAFGCTGEQDINIVVQNIVCGNNPVRILVCHKCTGGNTLCIGPSAAEGHLKHGDYLGQCLPAKESHPVDALPGQLWLSQNFPNPFNPTTEIAYTIPLAGKVKLTIYDHFGREIRRLVDEMRSPGHHHIIFDGMNLASGVYYYRLQWNEQVLSRRMTLLK
ncbi:T9SS type A sorting domain-containing protein [bacterium]|nr:T9SS type A sorting domain-containing protein [bacterium]